MWRATKPKNVDNTKAKTDVKLAEDAKAADTSKETDDGKSANDKKLTDVPAPVALATDLPKSPIQTVAPAVVVAPAPTTAVVNPPATKREPQTATAAIQAADCRGRCAQAQNAQSCAANQPRRQTCPGERRHR